MEILFTKQELKESLLYASKKSNKLGLDSIKVEKMIGKCVSAACLVQSN